MGQTAGHRDGQDALGLETGLEAFQTNPEFHGPVESFDGHRCNDHFAHIYETPEEKFSAAIPFIRHGLERGEHVMYVVDESIESDARATMRDAGLDVDAAIESGALTFHTVQETYLRNGSFDTDEMIEFYGDTVSEAAEEYEALRIVAEMTWLNDDDTPVEQLMEYEQKINDLFDQTDSLAICQYNRELFAPEVIRNVVRTHPHLIYDGTACHNVYYTPPEEFFGADAPARENERMLRTLQERTTAKAKLQYRERLLQGLYDIAADPTHRFEEKLNALFDFGCEQFGFELGGLAKVDPDTDFFEVEHISGDHDHLVPGARVDLSETYCRVVADVNVDGTIADPIEITDPAADGFADAKCVTKFGVHSYLGTRISVDGGSDRTFFFVDSEPRDDPVPTEHRMFHKLMAQWVSYELNRRQREQFLRKCYKITSDPTRRFDEKLDALLDLGCEQFGLDYGGLARIDPDRDLFEVEEIRGDHDHLIPGEQYPLSETYCQLAAEDGETAAVTDPAEVEFEDKLCYKQFGVQAYLGTHLPVDGDVDRTFWFLSNESRDTAFTDMEQTFTHLMGEWVRYEIERRQQEWELRRTKNRFETIFEQSDDGIFILDSDTDKLVDANPAAAEMTGYTRDELLSQTASDLHPDELEQFHTFIDEVHETGSAWSESLHCRHKDGHDIPVEITASTITLDGCDLVLALVRRIQDRKKHERYQRDLYEITSDPNLGFGEKLERLLELGRDRFELEMAGLNHLPSWDGEFRLEKGVGLGIGPDEELWTDPDNDCYCRQTITEENPVGMVDVRGTHWAEDVIYQEFGITSYLGTKVSSGATAYGTLWFGSSDPRDRPFSEAERSFIELMGQWVSYEIEQREHNSSQRELYEITADPDFGADEKIQRLLEIGCERLNLPVGMLTRKRERAFEIEHMNGSHPDLGEGTLTPPLTDNYCRRVVDTGESISVGDAGAAGWDGDALYHEFDLKCYAGTQITVRGENYGTVCFTDLEPREEFTEAEQAFLDLLGQCVGYEIERQQNEADLEETINQLEQSNDRLRQFAYAASHDLQEPLRMVSSYLQLLENRYRDDLDEDAQEFIDFAVNGADRMRAMVDDLLAFSRVEQADGEFEPVDCDAVLDSVTDNLQLQIEESDAEIASESLPTVIGDQEQLRQLFSNLISNGIKYNENDQPRVEISADRQSDQWVFSVTDDGIGIDPDQADRIFEVFKRLHHDEEYSGTGIGLSLCQKIANNHGGDIWVESEPGEGSVFSFTLPAVDTPYR